MKEEDPSSDHVSANVCAGKTLVARALANECARSGRHVSFFMRKGADCLSKWVGESERMLRLLFDQVLNSSIAQERAEGERAAGEDKNATQRAGEGKVLPSFCELHDVRNCLA